MLQQLGGPDLPVVVLRALLPQTGEGGQDCHADQRAAEAGGDQDQGAVLAQGEAGIRDEVQQAIIWGEIAEKIALEGRKVRQQNTGVRIREEQGGAAERSDHGNSRAGQETLQCLHRADIFLLSGEWGLRVQVQPEAQGEEPANAAAEGQGEAAEGQSWRDVQGQEVRLQDHKRAQKGGSRLSEGGAKSGVL